METVSFDSFSSWAVDWLEWSQHLYPGQQMLPDTTADYQHQLIATKYEKHNLFLERQSSNWDTKLASSSFHLIFL